MKIVIVRHGEPDYSIDSLTPKGWKEAEYLSERIAKMDVKEFYCSPLGRAKDTASLTLKKMNRQATECKWMREFDVKIHRPDKQEPDIAWDWLPQDWTKIDAFYDKNQWIDTPVMKDSVTEHGDIKAEYEWAIHGIDEIIAKNGYVREGNYYRVKQANMDTIVLFCHFGLECVLLSHILNISPMVLWHNFCAAPTSVTTLITEERREGIASFRMAAFGDISHLYAHGEPPAFAARFCECYTNAEERHD